jgi:hypothetical protein
MRTYSISPLVALIALFSSSAIGHTGEHPPPTTTGYPTTTATDSCYTLTTQGPTCTTATCPINACLKLSTITQSCGCPSIYTAFTCTDICTNDCAGTNYETIYLPCPTTPPASTTTTSDYSTTTTTSASVTISSYSNSTITTNPSGGGGGATDVTVTDVTTTTPGGNTPPQPTTSSVVPVVPGMADRSALANGGLLAALFAAVLGFI